MNYVNPVVKFSFFTIPQEDEHLPVLRSQFFRSIFFFGALSTMKMSTDLEGNGVLEVETRRNTILTSTDIWVK